MDIRDIAKHAGVSTATVSRTINRIPTVAPKLAKPVWKAVDELGYYPNTQARALVSGRSRTFGLIVSEIANPFFPKIIEVFEHLGLQHGYEILLSSTVHDPKLKVNPRFLAEGDHTSPGGVTAMQSLLALKNRPTAVLCSNDLTAIGVMRCAYDARLKIPQDLSVVGFDNIWISEFTIPPLTTVQMSQTKLAEVAFNALLVEAQREEHPPEGSQYMLTTSLLFRSSTAPARAR